MDQPQESDATPFPITASDNKKEKIHFINDAALMD